MVVNLARNAFVIVVLVTVAGTVFRVVTAPERIKDRRDTARSVCTGSGGQWVQVGRDELCQRADPGSAPSSRKI
jgi:hypothetical protein